jgi:hypothetical protein
MLVRGRQKRLPSNSKPIEPSVFSRKSAHFEFDPNYAQISSMGTSYGPITPFVLVNSNAEQLFRHDRLGGNPGQFYNFWILYRSSLSDQAILSKENGLTGLVEWEIQVTTAGRIRVRTYPLSGLVQTVTSNGTLAVGSTRMVTVQFDQTATNRTQVSIYFNNSLDISVNLTGGRVVSSANVVFGASSSLVSNYCISTIDNFLYRRSLLNAASLRTAIYNGGSGLSFDAMVADPSFPKDKATTGFWKCPDSSGGYLPDRFEGSTDFQANAAYATVDYGIPQDPFYWYPALNNLPGVVPLTVGSKYTEKNNISTLKTTDVFAGGTIQQTRNTKVPTTYFGPIDGQIKNNHAAPNVCYFNGTDVHYETSTNGVDVLKNRTVAEIFIVASSRALVAQDAFFISSGTGSERFVYSRSSGGDHVVYFRRDDAEATPQIFTLGEKYVAGGWDVIRIKLDYQNGMIYGWVNGRDSGSQAMTTAGTSSNTNSSLIKVGAGLVSGSNELSLARVSCFIDELANSEVENYYEYIRLVYDISIS